jgi:hydrogenase-4 component B
MSSIALILGAIAGMALSGLPAVVSPRGSVVGQRCSVGLLVASCLMGLAAVVRNNLPGDPASELDLAWGLPFGRFAVELHLFGIIFLLPVLIVPALGAIYSLSYWRADEHPATSRRLSVSYGLLTAAMAMVTLAQDSVLFLIAWEVMALSAFFAATAEDDQPEVRRAGWTYLVATHLGTLCLIACFVLLHQGTGTWRLVWLEPGNLSPAATTTAFVLALVGFGCKAGLMPLHVWLPGAHANAPSHVSAVMSGVMLKMGIYGLLRALFVLIEPPVWWGGLLLVIGGVTGILGIAFAIGQQDLKRLLAYSSVENIGIITMALGLAELGLAMQQDTWVLLGACAAMLHIWNHSLFKSLLFLNAGAIIHATGTRRIDQLGGLGQRMPRTALLFAIGAVAICALPPLNGFASEFVLYLGLLQTIGLKGAAGAPAAALGAVALATIGALAVVCFIKLGGALFWGAGRSQATAHAHDPAPTMLWPMVILAGGCVLLGTAPALGVMLLDPADLAAGGEPQGWWRLEPLFMACTVGMMVTLAAGIIAVLVALLLRRRPVGRPVTWDCGYAQPTARMQYTGSSFGDTVVGLFGWALWPRQERPRLRALFPTVAACRTVVLDTVLDRLVLPVLGFCERQSVWLRLLQQGRIQVYLLYILGVVLLLLLWGTYGH